MGMILIMLAIIFGITTLTYFCSSFSERLINVKIGIIAPAIIFTIICFFTLATSYSTYVQMFANEKKIEVARDTIRSYEMKYIDLSERGNERKGSLTDLDRQGVQSSLTGMISHYRDLVAGFNSKLISKRILKKNILFNIFIFVPDLEIIKVEF